MHYPILGISKSVLKRAFWLGLSSALVVPTSYSASLLLATNALAACSPTSGVVANPGTVLCLDDTLNQDSTRNYGTGAEDNVTLTVQQDATVTGNSDDLRLGTDASITNLGAIEGLSSDGAEAVDITSLTNSGTIKGGDSSVLVGLHHAPM